jgi:hypothetical protein
MSVMYEHRTIRRHSQGGMSPAVRTPPTWSRGVHCKRSLGFRLRQSRVRMSLSRKGKRQRSRQQCPCTKSIHATEESSQLCSSHALKPADSATERSREPRSFVSVSTPCSPPAPNWHVPSTPYPGPQTLSLSSSPPMQRCQTPARSCLHRQPSTK